VLAFSGMVAFAYLRSWLALLVAALAWGTGSGANWVLSQSALQRRAGDRFIGRLASIDELAVALTTSGSAAACALIIGRGVADRFRARAAASSAPSSARRIRGCDDSWRGASSAFEDLQRRPKSVLGPHPEDADRRG